VVTAEAEGVASPPHDGWEEGKNPKFALSHCCGLSRLVHIYADRRGTERYTVSWTAPESRSNTAKTVEGAAMPKLDDLGVAEAAKAIRTGETTAEALADALLARAAAHASLNAFIAFEPDKVRAAAREADRKRAAGTSAGPLHGVPLALKDNLNTADYATTGGTPGLAGNRPKRNAVIVQALLDAGAIVLGKCNLHELAYGITNNNAAFGPARNPYAPDRIPGASSGGTGVAVAARLAPGGIGSDTGGSVRIPAALCGIVGLRPTPDAGRRPASSDLAHRDTAGR
jgi:mandelamide amidase